MSGLVALEDCIMQKDMPITVGSKILDGFVSPVNATIVNRLMDSGYEIAGKTAMDEFCVPSFFDESGEALDAIQVVSEGRAQYALSNDVFGKYRKQAAENGCCYIRPTYGTVSRFGLVQSVSSMDQIGVVCKNLSDGFALLSKIAGRDSKDGAMFSEENYSYAASVKDIRVGVPKSLSDFGLAENFRTVDIELEYFDVYRQVMYILCCAELGNNISRYDGIKFGYRAPDFRGINDLYTKTRSEGFGANVKLAAIMGAMVLSQDWYTPYYEKAMKIRRLIKESLRFDDYDVIAMPCQISENPYENLSLFAPAALAGLPSVSFPHNGKGIQLIANVKREDLLLSAWEVCK